MTLKPSKNACGFFNKYHLLETYAYGICMCKLQLWDTQKNKKQLYIYSAFSGKWWLILKMAYFVSLFERASPISLKIYFQQSQNCLNEASKNFCFLKIYSTIIKFLVLKSLVFEKYLFSDIINAAWKKKHKFMKNTLFPEQ